MVAVELFNRIMFGGVLPVLMTVVSILLLPAVVRAGIRHLPALFRRPRTSKKDPAALSPLAALSVALGGTLGVGNISGIALALSVGGAGTLFWLWVASFLSAALKYGEVALSILYRPKEVPPTGGAMYYIEGTVGGKKGRNLATVFAALCLPAAFLIGILPQSGAVAEAASEFGVSPVLTGGIFFLLALPVVLGGAKRISRVVSAALPPLCILYALAALTVIFSHADRLPSVFSAVFREAFSVQAAVGGGMGFGITRALRVGFARAVFSGEAGCGTAPMAYAAGSGRDPERQGLLGVAEVAIDALLCTLTALVLLTDSPTKLPLGDMRDVTAAFRACLGEIAPPLLAVAVFIFAFATVLAWAHYAATALRYLGVGERGRSLFSALYAAALFPGALLPAEAVFAAADANLALLAFLNAAALFAAAPLIGGVKRENRAEIKGLESRERVKSDNKEETIF